MVWSDEKRFAFDHGDGPERVFRVRGARLTDKDCVGVNPHGGGSIMVWGCFGFNGVGVLVWL